MNHITREFRTLVADEGLLDMALEGADVAPLLMVLVHLTGEEHWLDAVVPSSTARGIFRRRCPTI